MSEPEALRYIVAAVAAILAGVLIDWFVRLFLPRRPKWLTRVAVIVAVPLLLLVAFSLWEGRTLQSAVKPAPFNQEEYAKDPDRAQPSPVQWKEFEFALPSCWRRRATQMVTCQVVVTNRHSDDRTLRLIPRTALVVGNDGNEASVRSTTWPSRPSALFQGLLRSVTFRPSAPRRFSIVFYPLDESARLLTLVRLSFETTESEETGVIEFRDCPLEQRKGLLFLKTLPGAKTMA